MCLSIFYPVFWVFQLLVAAAPLVISVVSQSARITGAEINYFSVFLVSTGQTQPPALVTFAVIITTGALAALGFVRFGVLSWLCLAVPAYLACSQLILNAVFVPSQLHLAEWLALLGSFGATVAGLSLAVRKLESANKLAVTRPCFARSMTSPGFKAFIGGRSTLREPEAACLMDL